MQLYEKVFGAYIPPNPTRTGNNIIISCCFHANDDTPSLCISTDENKPVYHCFGCNKSGSLIGAYMELNNLTYFEALKQLELDTPIQHAPNRQIIHKPEPPKIEIDYSDYCYKVWNETIMHEKFYEFYAKKLYDLRGITYPTAVACMIGYDPNKGWIFPCVRYKDNKIVGYEIREKYFQKFKFKNGSEIKCYKAEHTPSCICTVFDSGSRKKAIFCEGFIDSYFMYQYKHELAQKFKGEFAQVDCTILTSSNGVAHIPTLVEEAKLWNDFDEIIFCLDNDPWKPDKRTGVLRSAGNEAKQKLIELPHEDKFKFFNLLQEGEDFEEFYKRVLVKELYKCN